MKVDRSGRIPALRSSTISYSVHRRSSFFFLYLFSFLLYFFFPFLVLLAACYAAVLTGAPADRSRGGPTQTPNGRERERDEFLIGE